VTVITGRNNIKVAQMIVRKSALKLELAGMKVSRGRSVYAMVKEEHGLKGNKERVYTQYCELVETEKRKLGL